jgi:hypothetical protein
MGEIAAEFRHFVFDSVLMLSIGPPLKKGNLLCRQKILSLPTLYDSVFLFEQRR